MEHFHTSDQRISITIYTLIVKLQRACSHALTSVETQDYSEASQLTDRIHQQAAVVDITNVIDALNTSAYYNTSAERHQLPLHDNCYMDHTLTSHPASFLSQ